MEIDHIFIYSPSTTWGNEGLGMPLSSVHVIVVTSAHPGMREAFLNLTAKTPENGWLDNHLVKL